MSVRFEYTLNDTEQEVPHTVFIVPYRNRERHKQLLDDYLDKVFTHNKWTEGKDVMVLYSHQCDKRPFNRGAMKNIGFIALKTLFPSTYKNITLVFHDVDSIPQRPDMLPYATETGVVSHYYGYEWALGGIFSIKAGDFETTGGFCNFWGWGLEDNCMKIRCDETNLQYNRSVFYDIKDPRIKRPFDGVKRVYSLREANILKNENPDSWRDIQNLQWSIENRMLNVTSFTTARQPEKGEFAIHDIRQGSRIPVKRKFFRKNWNMFMH